MLYRQTLWKDPGVRSCYDNRHLYQLQDSASFFLDDLDRIFSPDYDPTTEDILKVRVRTTGVIEAPFQVRFDPFFVQLQK